MEVENGWILEAQVISLGFDGLRPGFENVRRKALNVCKQDVRINIAAGIDA